MEHDWNSGENFEKVDSEKMFLTREQQIRIEALTASIALHKTNEILSMAAMTEMRHVVLNASDRFVDYITNGVK